ncbi:uncharacterized protein F4822DRAFT_427939 [Hypoxylon trugodes]|uniref:uncharacterized protein n=1 Tax=Hypoxylon trugodes TaxID=326681 RepID=UPI002197F46D|nr:uncharacterized protein F4822DRAFT_427939 [Hypoxylon trugodes]KAI1389594.1 hypothetical protein F4822DRAFT_427939 [Hypoxylon trugodes]
MASKRCGSIPLHESFNDPKSEIRLLEIDDEHTGDIRWRMSIISLKDKPQFTALSYVWGDPTITNQLVICWLGPSDPKTHLAFDTIHVLHTEWIHLCLEELIAFEWIRGHPSLHETLTDDSSVNQHWDAVQTFARLKYWRRTWILQEVILGKKAIIAAEVGRSGIDWPTFICPSVWKTIKNIRVDWAAILFFFYTGASWANRREQALIKTDWQLAAVAGRMLQATNPKDHYIAIMLSLGSKIGTWVLTRMWKSIIFCYIRAYLGRADLKLPSWVPNFPALSAHRQEVYEEHRQFGELIADGQADHSVFELGIEGSTIVDMSLFVNGLDLGPIASAEEYGDDMSRVSDPTGKYIQQFVSEVPTYVDGSPSLEAVFRLFCRKSYGMGQPIDADGVIKALGFLETLLQIDPDGSPLSGSERREQLESFGLEACDADAFASSFVATFAAEGNPAHQSEAHDILGRWYNSPSGLSSAKMELDDDYLAVIVDICLDYLQQANRGARQMLFRIGPYIGVSQRGIQVGDRVCILKGSNTLSVLRGVQDVESQYYHIAPCFVIRLMNGEAKSLLEGGLTKMHRFEIL